MKISNTIWLFVLVFLMVIGIFLFLNKSASKTTNTLAQNISCDQSEKLDESILSLPANTESFKAFISFQSLPLSDQLLSDLKNLGLSLDQNSAIFDYLWASIPVDSLCQVLEKSEVNSVFTAKQ